MKLQRVEFNAPFECFVHRWDRLLAEREALAERREKERVVTEETDALQVRCVLSMLHFGS